MEEEYTINCLKCNRVMEYRMGKDIKESLPFCDNKKCSYFGLLQIGKHILKDKVSTNIIDLRLL